MLNQISANSANDPVFASCTCTGFLENSCPCPRPRPRFKISVSTEPMAPTYVSKLIYDANFKFVRNFLRSQISEVFTKVTNLDWSYRHFYKLLYVLTIFYYNFTSFSIFMVLCSHDIISKFMFDIIPNLRNHCYKKNNDEIFSLI